jgi:dihydropteroate synthase-like protein
VTVVVMPRNHVLFVTGKLAEPALRRLLGNLAPRVGFEYTVAVLPISVAALATTSWIASHLTVPAGVDRVVLPGLCEGDLTDLAQTTPVPVERGPKDLRSLPEMFEADTTPPASYGAYDIQILAEINHVPRLSLQEVLDRSRAYQTSGADIIDLGCDPGGGWASAHATVRALRAEGLRVSIDSFDRQEVEEAVAGGAELVLSVNGSNREAACSWGCEVVALPDVPASLGGLDETVACLRESGVPFRIDPIIEPIGFGFAASLGRYLETRRRYPDAEIMMGIGNLTELTDVDSSGINVALLGFCQELGIRSVLTTEVINWCRSAVRELDLARRLVFHAVNERVLPKHLAPDLVLLRDPKVLAYGTDGLRELAAQIKDRNLRLFAEDGRLHVINSQMFLQGTDPFTLFAEISARAPVNPAHAFYLGYEMAKAVTALTLDKNYVQDQALRWGFLTVPEEEHGGTMKDRAQE